MHNHATVFSNSSGQSERHGSPIVVFAQSNQHHEASCFAAPDCGCYAVWFGIKLLSSLRRGWRLAISFHLWKYQDIQYSAEIGRREKGEELHHMSEKDSTQVYSIFQICILIQLNFSGFLSMSEVDLIMYVGAVYHPPIYKAIYPTTEIQTPGMTIPSSS